MRTYFLAASQPNVGLTSVSLGLVRALQQCGLKLAFVKPITKGTADSEPSVLFARSICGLENTPDPQPINPVSYTHLDVYKRQTGAKIINRNLDAHAMQGVDHRNGGAWVVHGGALGEFNFQPLGRSTAVGQQGLDPVSYTHLDVYKRQVLAFKRTAA